MAEATQNEEDDRYEDIARVVHSYMREGESLNISNENGEIYVSPAEGTPLRESHPRLYGRLASVSEQLTAGCAPFLAAWFLGLVFVFCLHAGFVEAWWGEAAAQALKWWGFYALLFVGLTFLVYLWSILREGRVFRRVRGDLYELMRREGVDRDSLVSLLAVEPELRPVMVRMKLDSGPFEPHSQEQA